MTLKKAEDKTTWWQLWMEYSRRFTSRFATTDIITVSLGTWVAAGCCLWNFKTWFKCLQLIHNGFFWYLLYLSHISCFNNFNFINCIYLTYIHTYTHKHTHTHMDRQPDRHFFSQAKRIFHFLFIQETATTAAKTTTTTSEC